MVLEINTGIKRNYYIWSIIGIICFSLCLNIYKSELKSAENNFEEQITLIGIGSCAMGIVGIFLTLISCCRMYLRLGIVPGIYHSTICIPS